MTNYYTDVFVSPPIPLADMTALERLYLSTAFEEVIDLASGAAVYGAPEIGVRSFGTIDRSDLMAAIATSRAQGCGLVSIFEELLAEEPELDFVDFELNELPTRYEEVLQGIARRSETVKRFLVYHAFTCDNSDPSGFGGAVDLIEPNRQESWSTYDQVAKWRQTPIT